MSDAEPKDSTDQKAQELSKSEQPKVKSAEKKQEAVVEKTSQNIATFENKIEIFCDEVLPLYKVGPNTAYRAYAMDGNNKIKLIAIVCERHLVPRRKAANVFSSIANPNLAKMFDHGVVYWPLKQREQYVFFYYDDFGKPLLLDSAPPALGWKQDEVMNSIVKPMASILQDFRDKDFVHGNIRPGNMFGSGDKNRPETIILGDCLSVPASYAQPVLYETIHRSMAEPIARGKGSASDDLYSFGVSLAVIMRQNDPMAGLSDTDIIKQKMTYGSYAAITGKDRFKGEILELLRGVLHDDASQRWTIDEVLEWLDGRRLSPKQAIVVKKAPRPFVLGEDRYFMAPLMAMDLNSKVKEVKKAVEDESLLTWIERSLEDEETSERLKKSVVDARKQSSGAGHENCLVSNVSIALAPNAPLRYKGLCVMGDGIGSALAEAVVMKKSMGVFAEMFINSLVLNWLSFQSGVNIDVTALFARFEKCKRFFKTSRFGQGPERSVYVLSPECHCLSPILDEYYVTGPEELLLAFEDLCKRGRSPSMFLDRHSVAFLCEKDPKVIETYIFDLNTYENHRTVAANLKCLAAIQKRYKMKNTPALAKVMAPRLQAIVQRYHDRNVQNKLKESVVEFQKSGDLVKIAEIFDNSQVSKKDLSSFMSAMSEYKEIEEERAELEVSLQDQDTFGIKTGKEVSAIISSVFALLIILAAAFMFLSDNSSF